MEIPMRNLNAVFAVCVSLILYSGCTKKADNPVAPIESWTLVNTGLTSSNVATLAINGTSLFAGVGNGAFYSSDSGGHWNDISNGLPKTYVRSFAFIGSNLFAGTDSGVFLSSKLEPIAVFFFHLIRAQVGPQSTMACHKIASSLSQLTAPISLQEPM